MITSLWLILLGAAVLQAQPAAPAALTIALDGADCALSLRARQGFREGNPLFGRKFDTRDIGLKFGITAGQLLAVRQLARQSPRAARAARWLAWAGVAIRAAVVGRNIYVIQRGGGRP